MSGIVVKNGTQNLEKPSGVAYEFVLDYITERYVQVEVSVEFTFEILLWMS